MTLNQLLSSIAKAGYPVTISFENDADGNRRVIIKSRLYQILIATSIFIVTPPLLFESTSIQTHEILCRVSIHRRSPCLESN